MNDDEMLLKFLYNKLPIYKDIAKENYMLGFYTKFLNLKVFKLENIIEKEKLITLLDLIQLQERGSDYIKIETLKDTLKDHILLVRNTF